MIRRVGVLCKPGKEEARAVVAKLLAWLRSHDIEVSLDPAAAECAELSEKSVPPEDAARRADLLVVLGGDGTLLAAARLLDNHQVPILAINLGGLGFLTSVTLEELYPLLEEVLAGRHRVSKRMTLEAELLRGGKAIERQRALNDAVITKGALSRMIAFDLLVDANLVGRYRADGLIVSTPTGSTAYSLAAGGPILDPHLHAFVVTPICPHMLTNRPLVIPDSARVEVDFAALEETVFLTLDGQVGSEVRPGDRVAVFRSANHVLLVRPQHKTYFEVLRNKLRWGER